MGYPLAASRKAFRFVPIWVSLLGIFLLLPAGQAAASIRLDVPFHRQEHSLSCEIAALKMALSPHGITVSETELIQKLPFDPAPKTAGTWGDPNKGFVGSIDGQMLINGYGVYWDPIASLGSEYARTEVIRHGSAADIARHLTDGSPVIIWGYYGRRAVYDWQTPAGDTVKAVNGEHTRVVYGFDGSIENPTRFYLIDPIAGYLSWSTDELIFNWSALGHMGVAVAPPGMWVRVPGDTKVWEIDSRSNTRRWVTTWQSFTQQGGTADAIKPISEISLLQYTQRANIL